MDVEGWNERWRLLNEELDLLEAKFERDKHEILERMKAAYNGRSDALARRHAERTLGKRTAE